MRFMSAFLLLIAAVCGTQGSRPGFRSRITQHGMDYGAELALNFLMDTMGNLTIPDVRTTVAGSSVHISNMHIVSFPRPDVSIFPLPGVGLAFHGERIFLTIDADFHMETSFGFWTITREGRIRAQANDLTFTLEFSIGRDMTGRLVAYEVDCSTGGDDIDITFQGSMSSVFNFVFNRFQSRVGSTVKAQLCEQVEKEIDQLSAKLASLPTAVTIDEDYEIDYRLVIAPQFTQHYMETSHKGSISLRSAPGPPPFEPPVIPAHTEHTSRMVYLYVTDYLMNTGLQSAYDNGRMAYNVSQEEIPEEARPYLRTACSSSVCIGTIFPQLGQLYPDSEAQLEVRATIAPVGRVSGNEVFAYGTGEAMFYIQSDQDRIPLFTVNLTVSGSMEIVVQGNRVVFNIVSITPRAQIKETFFGDVQTGVQFESIMSQSFRQLLYPKLHELGDNGVVLPSMEGVEFINGIVIDHDTENVFIIGTDIQYTPVQQPQAEEEAD